MGLLDNFQSYQWSANPTIVPEQRGTLVPAMFPAHVLGTQPQAQPALPGLLHAPMQAFQSLWQTAADERGGAVPNDQQNARDAFDVAGAATTGGLLGPKPSGILGSAGGKPISARGYRGVPHDKPGGSQFWGTDTPAVANEYAIPVRGDEVAPHVYPVQFDFQNPLTVDAQHGQVAGYHGVPFEGLNRTTNELADIATRRGHDGLVVRNIDDVGYPPFDAMPQTTYAALKPGTVRSATTGETLFANPATSSLLGLIQQYQQQRNK